MNILASFISTAYFDTFVNKAIIEYTPRPRATTWLTRLPRLSSLSRLSKLSRQLVPPESPPPARPPAHAHMLKKNHQTFTTILYKTIQHTFEAYFIINSTSTNPKEQQQLTNSIDRDYYVARGQKYTAWSPARFLRRIMKDFNGSSSSAVLSARYILTIRAT